MYCSSVLHLTLSWLCDLYIWFQRLCWVAIREWLFGKDWFVWFNLLIKVCILIFPFPCRNLLHKCSGDLICDNFECTKHIPKSSNYSSPGCLKSLFTGLRLWVLLWKFFSCHKNQSKCSCFLEKLNPATEQLMVCCCCRRCFSWSVNTKLNFTNEKGNPE